MLAMAMGMENVTVYVYAMVVRHITLAILPTWIHVCQACIEPKYHHSSLKINAVPNASWQIFFFKKIIHGYMHMLIFIVTYTQRA